MLMQVFVFVEDDGIGQRTSFGGGVFEAADSRFLKPGPYLSYEATRARCNSPAQAGEPFEATPVPCKLSILHRSKQPRWQLVVGTGQIQNLRMTSIL